MIEIKGLRGEGAGLLTNLAIEKLLEVHPDCICFLIDDTTEFNPLAEKLNAVDIHISPGYKLYTYKAYSEYVADNTRKDKNFFRFILADYPEEHKEVNINLINILAEDIAEIFYKKVFVIYKNAYLN